MRGVTWYNRQGQPISMEEAGPLLADIEYKRVAETQVGPYWVSTVWLGLDHNYWPGGPPLIFETMVFAIQRDDPELDTLGPDIDCVRYATLEEAERGHEEMVTLVRATIQEVPPTGGGTSPDVAFRLA
jgi:hypothetical protein